MRELHALARRQVDLRPGLPDLPPAIQTAMWPAYSGIVHEATTQQRTARANHASQWQQVMLQIKVRSTTSYTQGHVNRMRRNLAWITQRLRELWYGSVANDPAWLNRDPLMQIPGFDQDDVLHHGARLARQRVWRRRTAQQTAREQNVSFF